jgi:DNA-binding response OmpR family regulator
MDVRMIRYALAEEKNWPTDITVTDDGEKAIHYLLQQEPYDGVPRPDLLILDLNLPKRSGTEVLRMVRMSTELSSLPVIVLSSSPQDVIKDAVTQSTFTADLYLSKPATVKEYLALGRAFRRCHNQMNQVAPEETEQIQA